MTRLTRGVSNPPISTAEDAPAGPLPGPVPPDPARGTARRGRWLRAGLFTAAAGVAVALLMLTVSSAGTGSGPLDPDDPGRAGTRALAQVLRRQGVTVDVVRSIEALEAAEVDADTTVVVGDPAYLGTAAAERAVAQASKARRFVVTEPDDVTLEDLGLPVEVTGSAPSDLRARCSTDLADPTDVLSAPATLYAPSTPGTPSSPSASSAPGSTSCFIADDTGAAGAAGAGGSDGSGDAREPGAAVVVLRATGTAPETVVLGSAVALMNRAITDGANAALALRTLGPVGRVVWYVPDVTDLDAVGPEGQPVDGTGRGIPDWFGPGVVLVALVVVVYALARGRRLGRLVTEPLPVVVRAVETTEARGRLYHRASDRALAARSLRAGSRARLITRLGLPPSSAGLVDAVARATGRPPTDVEALLDGPNPDTDTDLLLLAQRLSDLEESVRPA